MYKMKGVQRWDCVNHICIPVVGNCTFFFSFPEFQPPSKSQVHIFNAWGKARKRNETLHLFLSECV